ncbi:MAG: class III lanthionine synthetase LanKC [Pseudonocardiaceae bacterium]
MDKRYEAYCLADRLFYDSTSQTRDGNHSFEFTCGPVPHGWERSILEDWLVHRPVGAAVPPQGWKVHVSACLNNAEKVLLTVWDYCVQHRIPFKFLRDRDALLLANAKYAHRGSSGKFVTIYPADEVRLEVVLNELGEALSGSQGPYILSDLRWGEGPLYVRYGGVARRYCVAETGALVLAIADPDGRLVPDRREPIFRLPAWVSLPAFLEPHLAARNSVKVDSVPYQIERVLHFSNGGGLYAGREVQTDARVVLKEARPHAGLDVDGTDALTRSRREREMLERLAGLEVVPAVHGSFPVGEHHFLALEFVDAISLQAAIAQRYLVAHEGDERTVAEYTSWALGIQGKVEQAVAAVHERGVVIGDLHPSNVLLRPDERVVLIDFEVAAPVEEGRRQTLANPGFAAPRGCTGFDIDRYALACLRLFFFLPLTMLFALDRAKANDLAAVISELFPVPASFLDEAVTVITAGTPARSGDAARRLGRMDPERDGWESIRASLAGAIVASATPERDDRLFPGDIAQFDTGGLNIAHGAAGVLYALAVTGAGRYPDYEEWLLRRAVHPAEGTTRWGFYDGLAGVAYVLDQFGYRAEALTVLDICRTELDGKWERLGLDLHSGLAGLGCALAHFAEITGDPSLGDNAFQVAGIVADRLGDENAVGDISGGAHPRAGLMHGCAGIALLFLRLYEGGGQPVLLELARTALRQDLRRCVVREDDGSMQVNEGWRTMPYLAEGSVGVGLVLDHYLAHRHDDQFAAAAEAIRRAAQAPFVIQPGLFRGRAGMILHLSRGYPPGSAARDGTVAAQLRRLAWHAIDYQGYLAFPGEQLLRLSLDLATGTAGVLLALGTALHPEPVHLPFLAAPIGPGPRRASTSHQERR